MARFVIAAEQRWKRSGKDPEKIRGLALGRLQEEYKRYIHLETYHHEGLAAVLKVRNSIAHNFYRRRMGLLQSSEGREKVIRELFDAIRLFQVERDDIYWYLSLVTGSPSL